MNNKYDDQYEFRMATQDDIDDIMEFIHDNWNANHILANDRMFFIWQFGREEYEDYNNINYIIMTDRADESIVGGIGFIPYSDNKEKLCISTAMTYISKKVKIPLAGVELIKRQMSIVAEKANFSHGTNPVTLLPIFKNYFHRQTGCMQKYYILNDRIDNYSIACIKNRAILKYETTGYTMEEIHSLDEIKGEFSFDIDYDDLPFKSKKYFVKRFINHPYYNYRLWIIKNNSTVGLLIGREVMIKDSKALLLVDFYGDVHSIEKIGKCLHDVMYANNYEYIDLLVSNMDKYRLEKAGFQLLDPDGEDIIPDHFEPFEQKNIKSWYQTNINALLFKADGDQDRPNKVR